MRVECIGKMDHGDEEEHHESEEQRGPAHGDSGGNAQRCGDQGAADEICPEQMPGHEGGDSVLDELSGGEMFGAEDRERNGETQVGQGDDFVEAAGLGDLAFCGQDADEKKNDASSAHGVGGAGDFEENEENECGH